MENIVQNSRKTRCTWVVEGSRTSPFYLQSKLTTAKLHFWRYIVNFLPQELRSVWSAFLSFVWSVRSVRLQRSYRSFSSVRIVCNVQQGTFASFVTFVSFVTFASFGNQTTGPVNRTCSSYMSALLHIKWHLTLNLHNCVNKGRDPFNQEQNFRKFQYRI